VITSLEYTGWPDRNKVTAYLEKNTKNGTFKTILDIGASASGWSAPYVTHYVDVNVWSHDSGKTGFIGSATSVDLWKKITNWVKFNGKFDFCICSHTLEDISNPQLVCEMMPKIAKEGYIAFPSKFSELIRHPGKPFLGWVHHRWIFNKEGDRVVAYPKLPFLEYENWTSLSNDTQSSCWELQFFWENDFTIQTVNNDYMGPSEHAVYEYFKKLLE